MTPQHRPTLAPHPARRIAATIVLGAPAAVAIWGSATALTAIAAEDRVTSPWTLPFCLDVLALGMVVVALLVPGRSFLRRATPWACYGFSAGLQVWEAWELSYRAWGTHAAGLVAAAIGSHVILDLWAPEAGESMATPQADVVPGPEPAPPHLEQPVALATVTPAVRRPAAPRRATPVKQATVDPELVERLRRAIPAHAPLAGVPLADVTQVQALAALQATPEGGAHKTKVGAALAYLKEHS